MSKYRALKFHKIARFNEIDDENDENYTSKIVNFPVNVGSHYRFRHVSGRECQVLMGG